MSGIKFELQKEMFEVLKERLHCVMSITKVGRKMKHDLFLCITGSIERPIRFTFYLLKKTDKGFKKKQEWTLSTLKEANYKSNDSTEFELHLDKLYQWLAGSMKEKEAFFSLLFQVCSRLHRPPKFLHYAESDKEVDGEEGGGRREMSGVVGRGEIVEEDEEDYGLTEREEADLEKVLSRVQNSVLNAEAYMEQLARELSLLDGENIQRMMECEGEVSGVLASLTSSISSLSSIQTELASYEDSVAHVRQSVEKIEEENAEMGVAGKNNLALSSLLSSLISTLDFPPPSALLSLDLNTEDGMRRGTVLANQLRDALHVEDKIHPALLKLSAVIEQRKSLERIQKKFSYNLAETLSTAFSTALANYPPPSSLRLLPNSKAHSSLARYSELCLWLKLSSPDLFSKILGSYVGGIGRLFEERLKEIFREAHRKISGINTKLSSSTSELRVRGRFFGKTRSLANKEFDTESQGSGEGSIDSSDRAHFYDVFEELLCGLSPGLTSEETFISSFFHIEKSSSSPSSPISPSRAGGGEMRKIMASILSTLEIQLSSFLAHYEKMEPSFCMGAMVRLGDHALRAENTSCYIGVIFGTVLIQEKRNFDRLMNSYVVAISETRLARKGKPGILSFVTEFEDFALMGESIFENSTRRSELEKWYVKMLGSIFESIGRHSSEGSSKVPGEVVRMENFHRLHAILSRLKVGAMEPHRKEAKLKYNEALNAYVTKYLGRPLVKLNEFFDGVQQKVSQGVKESEIGYQMAFSRDQLKKVIREYPGKEVKKGLDSLYKKVEKHLSEDESLLQVVWRAMQEEFIVQYKSLESLIGRCYPGAKIALEFSIEEILLFFSEIAQSH